MATGHSHAGARSLSPRAATPRAEKDWKQLRSVDRVAREALQQMIRDTRVQRDVGARIC
jgi:hypothetical protein